MVDEEPLTDLPATAPHLEVAGEATEAARKAILDCIRASAGVGLAEALDRQSRHSAGFMTTSWCRQGRVGTEASRTFGS